ncbi:MAG TPA: TRAM domain-containing protein, partial [Thermodesulfobacteriota bacterium]
SDQDFPKLQEVDAKLIELAKRINGRIITNDFNLNKVAELLGLTVLNINQLTNALKPIVLPGETIHIQILKEGKEPGQGVAYLDDGTMVVVEEGRKFIGKELDVVVTSVLQTTAGRMIFGRSKDEESTAEEPAGRRGKAHG